jgi:hypothetical protein
MVAAIAERLAEVVADLRKKPVEVRVPGIVA